MLLVLLLAPLAVVAGVTLLMQVLGVVSWDAPAHLYKTTLVRNGGAMLWDNLWYGGAYQVVTYGFVFYWLAKFVNYTVLVVVSAGALPVLFYLYMRRVYAVSSYLPSLVLAGVLVIYLSNGQDPFLFALMLTVGGMVLASYGQPLLATIPVVVAGFANPLAVMIGAIFLVAQYISEPDRRPVLARLALYLSPFAVARIVMGIFFWEPSTYYYRPIEIVIYVLFGVVGACAARVSADPRRRGKEILFLTFAAVAVLAWVVPANPVGGNFGRFFFVFGAPLLLTIRFTALRRFIVVPLVAGIAFGQLFVPAAHYVRVVEQPSARAQFFAPALAFAATHYDPNYRFHVVALNTHWEAYYFSIHDFPITRGWYRQADALHNELLNRQDFSEQEYVTWLRDMAVRYVFLPHAPLDFSGARETQILTTSAEFHVVFTSPQWTVFELASPAPMIQPLRRAGEASMLSVGHESVSLDVTQSGGYLIKVSYSPFWRITDGAGTIAKGRDDFLVLHAAASGYYSLRIEVTPLSLWREFESAF